MKHFVPDTGLLLLFLLIMIKDGSTLAYWPSDPPIDITVEADFSPEPRRIYSRGKYPVAMGTMAKIYEGVDRQTTGVVAIRVVWGSNFARNVYEQELQSRLQGEPNILGLRDYGNDNQFSYYITELADGDLSEVVDNQLGRYGLPESEARNYFNQLLNGLQSLRNNHIIHRDLKPENILVFPGDVVKIADFGLAVNINRHDNDQIWDGFQSIDTESGVFVTDSVLGTEGFISPEVCANRTYSYKSDIYALGMVLFYMLTKHVPHQPDCDMPIDEYLLDQMLRGASVGARDLVNKMLNANPNVRSDLEQIKAHPWVMATGTLPSSIRPPERKRRYNSGTSEIVA